MARAEGKLPDGVKEYKSPTSMVWLLGAASTARVRQRTMPRAQDAGRHDADLLSSYGKPYTPAPGTVDPAVDMKTPVRDQVNNLSTEAFLTRLAAR